MKNKKTQNVLAVVISGLAVIILFCILSTQYIKSVRQIMTQETKDNITDIAQQGEQYIQNYFTQCMNEISTLSSILSDPSINARAQCEALAKSLAYANNFKSVSISNERGEALDCLTGVTTTVADKESFKTILKGHKYISDVFVDKNGNEVFGVAVPIYKDGTVYGGIFATMTVTEVSSQLAFSFHRPNSCAYIINDEGDIIISSTQKDASKTISDIIAGNNNTRGKANESQQNLLKAISKKETGSGSFFVGKDEKLFAFTPVRLDKNWQYIVVLPQSEFQHASTLILQHSFFFVGITLFLLMLVFLFVLSLKNKSNRELTNLALYDQVTGIPNWTKFKLDCASAFAKSPYEDFAMITFDIDEFKVINDLYGHKSGDDTLRFVANDLDRSLLLGEKCARYSADTFLVLIHYDSDQEIVNRIWSFQKNVRNRINGYAITFSFGIYRITDKTLPIDLICDRTNLARNTIKGNHELIYSFYTEDIREHIIQTKEIENEMETALDNHEFQVYYQPKSDVTTGKIVGAEALIRWIHPVKGLIPPDEFIPLFEQNGFIVHIDNYVLNETCELIRRWIDSGIKPLPISVNISRVHLRNPNFTQYLIDTVKAHGISAEFIELELTETSIFENIDILTKIIGKLQDEGFLLSLDDFGSGYSSLNLLNELPVDVLKIDRMFFNKSADSQRGKDIVESIITMANKLKIQTVSEGVETIEQVNFLKKCGCDIAQGYYFSKPLPLADFEKYFKDHS